MAVFPVGNAVFGGVTMNRKAMLAGVRSILAASPVLAGGIAILNTVRTDDGDNDGFADTKETVSFRLTVQNTTGIALSGVTAQLTTDDDALACVSVPAIAIGNLAVGEINLTDPFVFAVPAGLDRGALSLGPYDDLSATFAITFSSQSGPLPAYPPLLDLDLDLDVSGGASPTSYFETFEGDLGTFEIDNMDQGLHSLAASDGYRCQFWNPDAPNSPIKNQPEQLAQCFLGVTPEHAGAIFWGLSGPAFSPLGGRAFTGFHSLFFGIDLGPPQNWTTPFAVLEAARTADPIALDWSGDGPTLSFKHHISLWDNQNGYPNNPVDRGVVMVQFADDQGTPVGNWIKLYPHHNPYTSVSEQAVFFDCSFDPIDDGNTEDDFFDPLDPHRLLGPSSTCQPEPVFAEVGETSNPFSPTNLGRADGPGLEGDWGVGTWIESTFDLSRFRGRQVRLRFLATSTRAGNLLTWEDLGSTNNPVPLDDGWWIDDVSIDQVLTTPGAVTADTTDNSSLPGAPGPDSDGDGIHDVCDNCDDVASSNGLDRDGDGFGDACDTCPYDPASADGTDFDGDRLCVENCPFVFNELQHDTDVDGAGDACDCAPFDPTVRPGAVEINDAKDNQCPGYPGYGVVDELSGTATFCDPANKNKFCWPAQQGATSYQVVRAAKPGFFQGCTALPQTSQLLIVDTTAVPAGQIRFYLARPKLPNQGSWGQNSAGQTRNISCAP